VFVRTKKSGPYEYLQVAESFRDGKTVRQRVIATLGRLDVLQATGQLDGLIASCGRFATKVSVLDAHRRGDLPAVHTVRIGPPMVFGRLWEDLEIGRIIQRLLKGRKFEFPVERAVFLTVLHRLFDPGSDRAAEKWRCDYALEGVGPLELHHLYRAMGWLGEELPRGAVRRTADRPAVRCTKDLIEEAMFAGHRDLFSGLDLVFFDTTSIYFEGEGGQSLGAWGHSKDHRGDLKQMVVGAVLDGRGRPICCQMWPGNTTDVKTLIPVIDRLCERFGIRSVSIVADRGMISRKTILALEQREIHYILGVRMRRSKEVNQKVLDAAGDWEQVYGPRHSTKDPCPLDVREVKVGSRRYVVCRNEEQARKDTADREAIVAALHEKLKRGDTSLVGNRGYRQYLSLAAGGKHFQIDQAKIERDARYDGLWVLQTDTTASAAEVALKYKELWMVESTFRAVKSVLRTRPIYHQCDETIRGHVFCSFLALVLMKELQDRMARRGWHGEWGDLRHDLDNVQQIEVRAKGSAFLLRSELRGDAGKAFQAAGVGLPPVVLPAADQP